MTDRIKKVSLIQHDSTDCGAACLASVIRYFGGHSSIENIRKLSGTSQSGTTMLGLYQAAGEYGMDAIKESWFFILNRSQGRNILL